MSDDRSDRGQPRPSDQHSSAAEAETSENPGRGPLWWRALYMLLFALLYSVAEVVLVAVVLFQFFTVLFTRRANSRVLSFGQSLSTYLYQILRFLTFNTERYPYPFARWPSAGPKE